ncbi:MAG: signal peptidase I [Planctomycetes bacterium]|nr:signal peptidase I [Planctomycetota bacterium]
MTQDTLDPLTDRDAALRALGPDPSEEALRAFLRREDKAAFAQALEDAKALKPGDPCPVVQARRSAHARKGKQGAQARLEPTSSLINSLGPLLARPELSAEGSDAIYAARPSPLGRAVGLALGVAVVIVGMLVIFAGQESETGQIKLFAIGGALFLGGMGFITQVNQLFGQSAVARRIYEARRVARDGQRFEPPRPTWLQHNLKEVVVAAVLFLIVRQFAAEAFVIPTGSMAPTLYGNHFRVDCPACGYRFAFGKEKGKPYNTPETRAVECPTCHHAWDYVREHSGLTGGSKILVNKLSYILRPLERYEVAVFQFPEQPWNNYIKRIVGLPGDRLQIVNGDIYANDEIAPKPDHVQDAVWLPVFDSLHLDPEAEREWVPVGATRASSWTLSEDRRRLSCTPDEAGCTLRLRREVNDFCGYNQNGGRKFRVGVGDQRLLAEADLSPGAVLRLGARCGRTVWGRFVGGAGRAVFAIEVADDAGEPRVVAQVERPALSGLHEVALAYADLRARLIVDGETILAWDDPARAAVDRFDDSRLQAYSLIEVTGGPASLERVKVDRDIYYLTPFDGSAIAPLANDEYFACGDNSPNSLDSRSWGPLHEDHLLGRAILVWYPIPDWGWIR